MARYSRAGHRVICVTCTGGEHGEIVVPELDTPENHARLRELRDEELRRALERLGPIESRRLGYVDSGMMGTPQNDEAGSFWTADLDEAAGRLVRIVRETPAAGRSWATTRTVATGTPTTSALHRSRSWHSSAQAIPRGTRSSWPKAFGRGSRSSATKRSWTCPGAWRWPSCSRSEASRPGSPRPSTRPRRPASQREAQFARMAAATGPKTTSVDVRANIDQKLRGTPGARHPAGRRPFLPGPDRG